MRFLPKVLLLFASLGSGAAFSQSDINKYAAQCAEAIGGDIPEFSCSEGEVITINGAGRSDFNCDNPAHLSSVGANACIEGSRFKKLRPVNVRPGFNENDIEIRLLCRHYDRPANPADIDNLFDDIAIIASNVKNGASCFFQGPSSRGADRAGNRIPSPSDPNHNLFHGSASGCVGCHAIRPFIETPYLASVSPANKIRNILDFPKDKYWFPGNPEIKIFRSLIPGQTTCTNCHNIASSSETSFESRALDMAHQSIGLAINTNVNRPVPYMLRFASSDAGRAALSAHESCYATGSNCTIEDISTKAREEFERGRTVPIPPMGRVCGPNQTWNEAERRCVDNAGSGSKVDPNRVYTLVASHSGKCLDARGGSNENGTAYQQYDCNGTTGQTFRFARVKDDEYELKTISNGRCVSSAAGKMDNGNPMILWDCGGGSDQHVRLLPAKNGAFEVRFSNSNKCMDVQDFSNDNGKDVHQWDCSGGADQAWYVREASEAPVVTPTIPSAKPFDGKTYNLVLRHSGKCLDAKDGGTQNSTSFQQWDCVNNEAQKFRFRHVRDDLYSFGTVNSGRCVSSEGNQVFNGVKMVLWDCNNTPDQLVSIRPSKDGAFTIVYSNSNKCMSGIDNRMDNGMPVHQWDCYGNADQDWFLRETW